MIYELVLYTGSVLYTNLKTKLKNGLPQEFVSHTISFSYLGLVSVLLTSV